MVDNELDKAAKETEYSLGQGNKERFYHAIYKVNRSKDDGMTSESVLRFARLGVSLLERQAITGSIKTFVAMVQLAYSARDYYRKVPRRERYKLAHTFMLEG